MRYVFLLVLTIMTSSLAFAALESNLKEIVRSRAAHIMKMQQSGEIALHLGRKSLLLEMQNHPEQLGLDIGRIPFISIGDSPISEATRAHKSPEQLFLLIAGNLEKYLKERLPSVKNAGTQGRLGVFWTSEIIYSLAQTFLAPPETAARKEIKALEQGEWGSKAGTGKLSASFKIIAPHTFQVTLKSEKPMVKLSNMSEKPKTFVIETKILFDLDSGEVTFNYSYHFHGIGRSWSMQSFFMQK